MEIHKKWWISRIARAVHACVADGGGGLVILRFAPATSTCRSCCATTDKGPTKRRRPAAGRRLEHPTSGHPLRLDAFTSHLPSMPPSLNP
ncbi:MAG TPA: hypothetical protein P5195_05215 [Anaerolineae bacterium]|nr:hypothetical protein [Anaerolineae bacterium]